MGKRSAVQRCSGAAVQRCSVQRSAFSVQRRSASAVARTPLRSFLCAEPSIVSSPYTHHTSRRSRRTKTTPTLVANYWELILLLASASCWRSSAESGS
jgi:hypothetical protein